MRKGIKWTAGLGLAYTLLGFLILPPIIRAVAVRQLGQQLHREVSIAAVRLNPYALSVTVRGLRVKDRDAATLLSWDQVYVNLQLASFLGHPWVFREVSVSNPYVRVQVNKDYSLNFSDILQAHAGTNAAAKPSEPAPPLAVDIRQLHVEGARLEFTDLTPKQPFHRVVGPVKIALTDFRTDPNSRNPHLFSGSTDSGETFSWGGNFSLDPIKASGELAVDNVSLNKFAPLYEDFVRFEIRDGVAGFHVNYNFEMSATATNAAVSNLTATLRSFRLGEPGQTNDLLDLPEFSVSDVAGDLLARRLTVGAVAVRGATFNLRRATNANFNVVEMAQLNTAESAPGGILLLLQSATNLFSRLLTSTNLGTATVRDVAVRDCAVNFEDDSLTPAVRVGVDKIDVTARNLSNRPDTNMTTDVSLRWNTNGLITTKLNATLDPLVADLDVRAQQVELAPLSPYLQPFVNVYVLGSKVGMDGRIRVQANPGAIPTVTFAGNGALDDLNVLGKGSEDLLKWGALHFDGVNASLNPPTVTVSNVTLSNVAARLVMETNRTLNVMAILPAAATNATAAATETPPAASPGAAVGGGEIKRVFGQIKTLLGMDTNTFAALDLPKVAVGTVQVENGEIQFLDRSVTPPARASLQKIHAAIHQLSTDEMRPAQIEVQTLVGGTGPVEVTARLNPLHAKEATEAKISVKNVQLLPVDPYVGKYLGYRLNRGKLDVDLQYQITKSAVKGRNLVVLDQLTLGNKVASPDATSLPVKLAIALLKDRSGKIEIDVPVEGNLDDPKFRLGPVIWHVIGNVFVKAVTSPFALLGSLVGGGGGEDMQFQEFAPGSAQLDTVAQQKLATLAKALEARPELQLEIAGNVNPELDGWALRRAKLEAQLRTARWNSLRASARENLKPEAIVIAPEVRLDLVQAAYRDLVKTNPQLAVVTVPAGVQAAEAKPGAGAAVRPSTDVTKGASQLLKRDAAVPSAPEQSTSKSLPSAAAAAGGAPTPEQMENSLTAASPVSDADYAALAAARAQAVQQQLVQILKIAPDRITLGQTEAGTYGTNGNRVVLQLE